jgi:hypothetical protein
MELLSNLSLTQVIQNCQEQTANFLHKRISDTQYCFELFRRALAERNNDALNAVYEVYRLFLERSAQRHPLLDLTNEIPEYFGLAAFRSFQFAIRPEKFSNFTTLPQILRYLAACVDTSIKQHVRRFQQDELFEPEQDPGYTPDFEEQIRAQKLWDYICEVLEDENSILLAQCVYVYQMKPQEIVEYYPQIWPTANDVRVHAQKIKRKLHNNPRLRGWGQQ